MVRPCIPIEERFWKQIEKTDTCWIFNGPHYGKGYGKIYWNGKLIGTHRVSWTLHYGEIKNGLCVLHKCDNPPCVRPNHLFLGTRGDNNKDTAKKHRFRCGEKSHFSKLKKEDVLWIRKNYSWWKGGEISRKYGITSSCIWGIISRKNWKHI